MTSEPTQSRPESKGPGFDRTQWLVASLLFAMLFLNYVDRLVLSVLAPIMRDEIGLSQTDYAWAVNAFLLSYAVMYFGSGVILDRIGSRKGLTLFVALWSLASALHASVRGFLDLAFFRFLLGMTEPGGWTGAVKTVSERFNAAQRAIATGIFSTGASIATMVSPPLVVYLRNRWGWRLAFLIPSCAGFLWLPFWLKVTRRPALDPASADRGAGFSRAQLKLLGNRRVLAYVLARFFGDFSGYFPLFWMPDYLISHKGFSFTMMGRLAWIPFFFNDLGPLSGGFASNRLIRKGKPAVFSRKLIMTLAAVLVAAGALFNEATSTVGILAALSISTFGVGVWAGNLHTLPNDAFPRNMVATVHGLAGSAGAVGGMIFNTMVGYWSAAGSYAAVFTLWAILEPLGLIGMWLWLSEPPTNTSDPQTGPQGGEVGDAS